MRNLFFAALVMLPTVALAGNGPSATLKQINSELDKLLRQKSESGTPAEKRQKDELRTLADRLLDYGELSKRALSAHWEKLSQPQRDDFVTTLRELIERNYVKQLKSNLEYQIQYKNEQVEGDEATVATVVKVKTQGKTTDAEIVYKLRRAAAKGEDRWLVWDVITDEVSLVRNYRTQFHKIITEKSFDELLKKMKAKLAESSG